MIWVFVALIAVIVFVIAAVAIGREARRLDAVTPAPAFELLEAVDWIADRLPDDVRAELSYEDVRDLVDWHLADLAARGVAPSLDESGDLVIVDDAGAVGALQRRAEAEGRSFETAHVGAVLDAELAYFTAIGAVGPLADAPPEP